jgi:hypothetical protein
MAGLEEKRRVKYKDKIADGVYFPFQTVFGNANPYLVSTEYLLILPKSNIHALSCLALPRRLNTSMILFPLQR